MLQGVVLNLNMDAFDSAQVSADVHAKHLIGNRLFRSLAKAIYCACHNRTEFNGPSSFH